MSASTTSGSTMSAGNGPAGGNKLAVVGDGTRVAPAAALDVGPGVSASPRVATADALGEVEIGVGVGFGVVAHAATVRAAHNRSVTAPKRVRFSIGLKTVAAILERH
jgi:hypothetical protein